MAAIQYNRVIRKIVIGFGNLFDDVTLVRYNAENQETERFLIPIAYATKERYVMRLEEDLNLDKKVQVTLPRFSFEMTGFSYDSTRKLNTNVKNFASTNGGVLGQYNPVPYNFDFSLYLYVRNIEDATQVLEHILPYFTPDYTIKLNLIPEMGVVKELPIVLNNTSHEIIYEGNRDQETRMIIWTLNFTVKGYIFGKSSSAKVINHSITSILNMITENDVVDFVMNPSTGTGSYQIGEMVYQGYTFDTAVATAKVVTWTNNNLHLTQINGNFNSDLPIYGINSMANYKFDSYTPQPYKQVQIDVRPDPANANVNSSYTANTIITEYT